MGYQANRTNGGSRIRRLFGLGLAEEQPADDRQQLLNQIADFLLHNDLPVDAANLVRAHAAFSGKDPRLARKVTERQETGEAITQQWLEQVCHTGEAEIGQPDELHQLAEELERSITRFGQTTSTAKSAASTYTDELTRHVTSVATIQRGDTVLASLAHIARVMLERSREMEEEMRRSTREVESLRRNLAKARREAGIDHLTGLPNRRAFEDVFYSQREEAQQALEPLYLALVDIDYFKRVNDTHGHETGDRVIRAVGQALSRISDNCHVARHGGEEFVLLFRGLALEKVVDQLDSARERMAARRFVDRVSGLPIGEVTFSGGIADVFRHADIGASLRAADEALYRAKQGGRNRIVLD